MLNQQDMKQFTGTIDYTRYSPIFPALVLTDGALYVAHNGGVSGAFWLMDAIGSYQSTLLKKHAEWAPYMQFWKLEVKDKSAVLTCREDSGMDPVITQEIEYTDFDLPEITLWVAPLGDGKHFVIMLPSEY